MNWTQLLKTEVESAYTTTVKLMEKADSGNLEWKPATGDNWMTVSQLLRHVAEGCGSSCKAFLTGEWGLPEGMKFEDLPPEEMLPPAEKLPGIDSVESARKKLIEDKAVALEMIDAAGEQALDSRMVAAPWSPKVVRPLGWHFLQMIQHLERHKSQLYYYLKLQGKPVNTEDLWGA